MKRSILTTVLLTFIYSASAQTPQVYALSDNSDTTSNLWPGDWPFHGNQNVLEAIYQQGNFNNLPVQGSITDFYLKIASDVAAGVIIHGYKVEIGFTDFDTIPPGMQQNFQTFPNLTTVFYDTAFAIPYNIIDGDWLKVTLPTPFTYNLSDQNGGLKNLVVHISEDSNTLSYPTSLAPRSYFYYMGGTPPIALHASSLYPPSVVNFSMCNCRPFIGFDIQPNGINDITREKKLTVYPNPAKEALYLKNAEGQAYLITDIAGRVLLQGSMKGRSIDVGMLNSGLYLLRIGTETVKFVKE
ncbi:MAG TPA: T9SS type A sorting domain-containing protein [Flavipsychrobacter sp.]|nr:T9SS type A sorting domain-containing protein [Flavipsychrobacter sp.]